MGSSQTPDRRATLNLNKLFLLFQHVIGKSMTSPLTLQAVSNMAKLELALNTCILEKLHISPRKLSIPELPNDLDFYYGELPLIL